MQVRCVRGRWREELPGSAARWLLLPAWLGLRPAIALRNAAFNYGWRRIHKLPVPVWSVGNLTAGGTGKTPLTRYLAAWANAHQLHPAIISRGYGGSNHSNDEAKTVTECPVYCNPNRVAGGQLALSRGADCLILDDGFQHRRLHRDLDIVMIDATRPWGSPNPNFGATLPLGYLRESRQALRRAQVFAVTRSHLVSDRQRAKLHQQLLAFAKPIIHIVDEHTVLGTVLGGDSSRDISELHGKPVMLVSGIGNPLGFELAASSYGWQVLESWRFPDHYHYQQTDVAEIQTAAKRLQATIVITGKDAVKWQALVSPVQAAGIFVLQTASAVAESDKATLDDLLSKSLVRQNN
jgi:tetraacyldisaccharide 4'-kinase